MIYGLLAAAGWGTATAAAAVATRRATTYQIVLLSEALGVVLLIVVALITHPDLSVITVPVALGLVLAGAVGLVGYLALYRAIAVGPSGLMTAISSTYGGVAAGLALGVLGERLPPAGLAGIVLAVLGIVLAAARPASGEPAAPAVPADPAAGRAGGTRGTSRLAVPLALTSALAYGLGGFLIADYARRAGWLLTGIVSHGVSVLLMLCALPVLGRPSAWRAAGRTALAWAAAAGVADAAGLAAYARGAQVGQISITAAASSVYPAIPLIVGAIFLGERLRRTQLAGVLIIATGLVMLGLA